MRSLRSRRRRSRAGVTGLEYILLGCALVLACIIVWSLFRDDAVAEATRAQGECIEGAARGELGHCPGGGGGGPSGPGRLPEGPEAEEDPPAAPQDPEAPAGPAGTGGNTGGPGADGAGPGGGIVFGSAEDEEGPAGNLHGPRVQRGPADAQGARDFLADPLNMFGAMPFGTDPIGLYGYGSGGFGGDWLVDDAIRTLENPRSTPGALNRARNLLGRTGSPADARRAALAECRRDASLCDPDDLRNADPDDPNPEMVSLLGQLSIALKDSGYLRKGAQGTGFDIAALGGSGAIDDAAMKEAMGLGGTGELIGTDAPGLRVEQERAARALAGEQAPEGVADRIGPGWRNCMEAAGDNAAAQRACNDEHLLAPGDDIDRGGGAGGPAVDARGFDGWDVFRTIPAGGAGFLAKGAEGVLRGVSSLLNDVSFAPHLALAADLAGAEETAEWIANTSSADVVTAPVRWIFGDDWFSADLPYVGASLNDGWTYLVNEDNGDPGRRTLVDHAVDFGGFAGHAVAFTATEGIVNLQKPVDERKTTSEFLVDLSRRYGEDYTNNPGYQAAFEDLWLKELDINFDGQPDISPLDMGMYAVPVVGGGVTVVGLGRAALKRRAGQESFETGILPRVRRRSPPGPRNVDVRDPRSLQQIPNVGPARANVIANHLRNGGSPAELVNLRTRNGQRLPQQVIDDVIAAQGRGPRPPTRRRRPPRAGLNGSM